MQKAASLNRHSGCRSCLCQCNSSAVALAAPRVIRQPEESAACWQAHSHAAVPPHPPVALQAGLAGAPVLCRALHITSCCTGCSMACCISGTAISSGSTSSSCCSVCGCRSYSSRRCTTSCIGGSARLNVTCRRTTTASSSLSTTTSTAGTCLARNAHLGVTRPHDYTIR